MKKTSIAGFLTLVILGFFCLSTFGLGSELNQKIKKAKQELQEGVNTWNAEKMKHARDLFLNILMTEESEKAHIHYYTALCDYRLAAYFMAQDAASETEMHADSALKHLEEAMELEPSWGEPYALYASMLGFKVAINPSQGMSLGMEIYDYFGKALAKEPDNPRVNLMKGLSDLYTPEQFGGGADAAIQSLTKAVELFDKETVDNPVEPSWGKEEAYTFLGMAYKQKGDIKKAGELFSKALEVNPKFGLAHEELSKLEKNRKKTK